MKRAAGWVALLVATWIAMAVAVDVCLGDEIVVHGPAGAVEFVGPDKVEPGQSVEVSLTGVEFDLSQTLADLLKAWQERMIFVASTPLGCQCSIESEITLTLEGPKLRFRVDVPAELEAPANDRIIVLAVSWVDGDSKSLALHRMVIAGEGPRPPPVPPEPVPPVPPTPPPTPGPRLAVIVLDYDKQTPRAADIISEIRGADRAGEFGESRVAVTDIDEPGPFIAHAGAARGKNLPYVIVTDQNGRVTKTAELPADVAGFKELLK